ACVTKAGEGRREVDRDRVVRGRDLLEIARRLLRDVGLGTAELAREPRDAAAERRACQHPLPHEAGHLVAAAARAPLGALERELRLARDEAGQRRGVVLLAGAVAPA